MIVVAGHQQPAGLAEAHRRDAANDVVVIVNGQLLVATNIK